MGFLRVKDIAEQQGLNITTLGRKAELAYGTVHAIWHDKADQLNKRTLVRLARALDVKVADLFADDADKEPIDK